jgi:hypothetical protein
MRLTAISSMLLLALASNASAQGNLLDQGRGLLQGVQPPGPSSSTAPGGSLTNQQADSGLREALRVAAQRTVSHVGKPDGFLKDPAIHIPLPGPLETAKKGPGAVGASGLLDDLETRMNRAAETAAPKALDIFSDAIAKMSVTDAKAIVTGPSDAATQYFKRTTTAPLTTSFRPIVDRSLADAGALQAYHAASEKIGSGGTLGALGGALGGQSPQGGAAGFDFTGFVVDKALAGLFHYIGQEEASIRTNPATRSTELLKQVFGR